MFGEGGFCTRTLRRARANPNRQAPDSDVRRREFPQPLRIWNVRKPTEIPFGSLGGFAVLFVNVTPAPPQGMVSQCKSAKSALIFVRLFCVPPMAALPSGVLFAWPPP